MLAICEPCFASRMIPEYAVLGGAKADVSDVNGLGKVVGKNSHERVTQVLVEEKLHTTELARRRSRAAAKASAARMSLRDRSGEAFKIASPVIPPASTPARRRP